MWSSLEQICNASARHEPQDPLPSKIMCEDIRQDVQCLSLPQAKLEFVRVYLSIVQEPLEQPSVCENATTEGCSLKSIVTEEPGAVHVIHGSSDSYSTTSPSSSPTSKGEEEDTYSTTSA